MTRRRLPSVALAAALVAAAACGEEGPQTITEAAPGAGVKFFNFGVNAPGVNFFANDQKITATNSTACTPLPAPPADSLCTSRGAESPLGTASGSAAAGGYYTGIAPGQYTFAARLSDTSASARNVAVASFPVPVAAGRNYSVYLSGFYSTTARQVDGFVVEDVYPTTVSFDSVYVRFINASPNAVAMALYLRDATTSATTQLTPAVAYKAAGSFVAFPVSTGFGVSADLVTRNAGATANAITRTAVTLNPGRVYTIAARGDMTVTSTTAATRPQLDVTANR